MVKSLKCNLIINSDEVKRWPFLHFWYRFKFRYVFITRQASNQVHSKAVQNHFPQQCSVLLNYSINLMQMHTYADANIIKLYRQKQIIKQNEINQYTQREKYKVMPMTLYWWNFRTALSISAQSRKKNVIHKFWIWMDKKEHKQNVPAHIHL